MKSKIIKILSINSFILLIVFVSILVCKNIFNDNNNVILDEVKLKTLSDNTGAFAIMIGDTEGNYTKYESTTLPQKEDGYIFNSDKSLCVDQDGNKTKAEFKYRNNMVRAKVEEASLCYLYYDKISEGDFCIDRGITNLHDCLLVMEDYSYDTEEAIAYIEDKGEATTTAVAPTTSYVEKVEIDKESSCLTSSYSTFSLGASYTFDATTAKYTIKNTVTDILGDKYLDYYVCSSGVTCEKMYKIKGYSVVNDGSGLKQCITKADIFTNNIVDSFDSEIGLYGTDDEDGKTYFYRGAVKNNYVSYAGFIWRIIRINGDGSIRMIYAGTSTDATGVDATIGNSKFNESYYDPRYVGYTYGNNTIETETKETADVAIAATGIYYYSKGFIKNEDGTYSLLQGETNIKSGVWSEVYSEVIESYPYTCLKNSENGNCNVLIKLAEYVSPTAAKAYHRLSDNSADYNSAVANDIESVIKQNIDLWYEENIKDKFDSSGRLLSDYLYDSKFCNDRSLYTGDGFSLAHTRYKVYLRVYSNKKPSLLCENDIDEFSMANNNLKYPIALITADEVMLAGGSNVINSMYYLYINDWFWTMSPSVYTIQYRTSYGEAVKSDGKIVQVGNGSNYGVRPVINLSNKVKITEGIGTKEKPYIVTID